MSDTENKITMTEAELAAFGAAKVAEHDQAKAREAAHLRELWNPTTPPAPPLEPASPELLAELEKALDASGGNVDAATLQIASRLNVDVNRRPADPAFYTLFNEWSYAKACPHFAIQLGLVKNMLASLQRRRERAKAAV